MNNRCQVTNHLESAQAELVTKIHQLVPHLTDEDIGELLGYLSELQRLSVKIVKKIDLLSPKKHSAGCINPFSHQFTNGGVSSVGTTGNIVVHSNDPPCQ